MKIEIYTLKQDFIKRALEVTDFQFMRTQRPYLLLVAVDGYDYLIPMTHGENNFHSFTIGNQKLRYEKAFPLVNRDIISATFYESVLDPGTRSLVSTNYDNIKATFSRYLKRDYPTRYSLDFEVLIELQNEY